MTMVSDSGADVMTYVVDFHFSFMNYAHNTDPTVLTSLSPPKVAGHTTAISFAFYQLIGI